MPRNPYLLIREASYTYEDYEELLQALTTYTYNAAGKLVEKVCTEYDLEARTYNETPIADQTTNRYVYNAAGKISKRSIYDAEEILRQYVTAEYDAHGSQIAERYFRPDGSRLSSYVFEYDAQDRLMKRTWLDAEGQVRDYYTFTYDAVGHKVETCWFGADDVCKTRTIYNYGADGKKVRAARYNRAETMTKEQIYAYNAAGQRVKWTNRVLLVRTGEWSVTHCLSRYDVEGRVVERACYTDSDLLLTRDVYEYDAHGNKVKALCYTDEEDPFPNYTSYTYRRLEKCAVNSADEM